MSIDGTMMREFFRPRGIRKDLARERPYIPFALGEYEALAETEKSLAARWPARSLKNVVRQSGGLYMVRHAITELASDGFIDEYEGVGSPITAELRPWNSVVVNVREHRHDDGARLIPKNGPKRATREGWERERATNAATLRDAYAVVMRAKEDGTYALTARNGDSEVYAAESYIEDSGALRMPDTREDEQRAEDMLHMTTTHIRLKHPGGNVKGWHLVNEAGAKYIHAPGPGASRLEMHPWAHERLLTLSQSPPQSWYLVLSMEGVPKADAALQHILDNDLPATVADIPAVWNWMHDRVPVAELRRFAEMYLQDVHVKVVCDSDWNPLDERRRETEKPDSVLEPALALSDFLTRNGADAQAFAPTASKSRKHCSDGVPRYQCPVHRKRGMDDSIGDGDGFDTFVRVEKPKRERLVLVSARTPAKERARFRQTALLEYYRALGPGTHLVRYPDIGDAAEVSRMTVSRDTIVLADQGLLTVEMARDERNYRIGMWVTCT